MGRMVTRAPGGRDRPAPRGLVGSAALLLALSLVSAFAIIQSTHACRGLHTRLQDLEASHWQLQEDYGRLLLEQSTWGSHHRVEKVARSDLGMRAPDPTRLTVVPR